MYNSSRCVTKAESIDAMRKIVCRFVKQCTDVHMSLREVETFTTGYVEISGYFVQRQGTVYSAGVVRLIRFIRSLGKTVHDTVIAFENDFFEYYMS